MSEGFLLMSNDSEPPSPHLFCEGGGVGFLEWYGNQPPTCWVNGSLRALLSDSAAKGFHLPRSSQVLSCFPASLVQGFHSFDEAGARERLERQGRVTQMEVSEGKSHPEMGAAAWLILYMVLNRPF